MADAFHAADAEVQLWAAEKTSLLRDALRMDCGDSRIAAEIFRVERNDMCDGLNIHNCDKSRVVAFLS